MNRNNWHAVCLGVVISISTFSPDVWPGEGTLKPPCSRTIYLAKFSPGTVVIPENSAIDVPIGVLPFVSWDSASTQCGQPTSAALELTLACTPAAGGSPETIGPVSFDVPTPTTPGAQDVGSPLTFTIPEGIVTGTAPQTCVVSGTYTVTFGAGLGEGVISGTGDVPIVLMEPTILDTSRTILEVFGLPFDGSGYGAARRGDQNTNFFVVVNNHPTESVELDFTVTTNQTAMLPDGFTEENAAENLVYSIAWPRPGTGNFPLAFTDELDSFERIPLPDPTGINAPRIVRTLSIAAKAATMVPVDVRSFGGSGDGAGNEILAKITGSFSDGTPAYGAASTILNVNSVPPKLALLEYSDEIKVNADNFANFGRVDFMSEDSTLVLGSTHAQGNAIQEGFGDPFRVTEL
ncbi:MAG: hypothetical protein ACE5IY_14225, partial [bacterium]